MPNAPPPKPLSASTGEDCPKTGLWKVPGHPDAVARFRKGTIMPPLEGRAVLWELAEQPCP